MIHNFSIYTEGPSSFADMLNLSVERFIEVKYPDQNIKSFSPEKRQEIAHNFMLETTDNLRYGKLEDGRELMMFSLDF